MSETEAFYKKRNYQMDPTQRVRRGIELFTLAHSAIARQLKKQSPEIDDHELNLRVAERMYMARPDTLEILGRIRELRSNSK
jgi:hypothetical protein